MATSVYSNQLHVTGGPILDNSNAHGIRNSNKLGHLLSLVPCRDHYPWVPTTSFIEGLLPLEALSTNFLLLLIICHGLHILAATTTTYNCHSKRLRLISGLLLLLRVVGGLVFGDCCCVVALAGMKDIGGVLF